MEINIWAPTSFRGMCNCWCPRGIVLIKPYGTMAFGMFSSVHARAPQRTLKVKLTSRITQLLGPMFQQQPQLVWTGMHVHDPWWWVEAQRSLLNYQEKSIYICTLTCKRWWNKGRKHVLRLDFYCLMLSQLRSTRVFPKRCSAVSGPVLFYPETCPSKPVPERQWTHRRPPTCAHQERHRTSTLARK